MVEVTDELLFERIFSYVHRRFFSVIVRRPLKNFMKVFTSMSEALNYQGRTLLPLLNQALREKKYQAMLNRTSEGLYEVF